MIHMFQQTIIQKPSFDIFSADAIKAFYNLNRDLAMKKLKTECPEFFNLFMDKYNGSSNAFFFGLAQGVQKFVQTEGGGPGSPEMSFLYELGISEFVQNVTNLLRDPYNRLDHNGVFAGYIDDLYWAANFDKMVEVIKFVLERGPAYGYNLNMKKSIYLMAPTAMKLSEHEIKRKTQVLNDLGAPTQNIKVHPDCQLNVSSVLADERRAEWGIKIWELM